MTGVEQLTDNSIPEPNSGCWLWMGRVNQRGYPIHTDKDTGKRTVATRMILSWPEKNLPSELLACHHCDNPSCVNPRHLFVGTNKQNMKDCTSKGRHAEQKKTHCQSGHEFSLENTRIDLRGFRVCRTCRRDQRDPVKDLERCRRNRKKKSELARLEATDGR